MNGRTFKEIWRICTSREKDDICRQVEADYHYLSAIANGKKVASEDLAKRIHAATGAALREEIVTRLE
jgi:hypothetical protein